MKKIVLIIISLLLICGCSKKEEIYDLDINNLNGMASNLVNTSEREFIKKILYDNKLDNIDVLFDLIKDFNSLKDKGCGIVNKFSDVDKIKYDEYACADRYEKKHDISDGNCRITAFTLLMNHLNVNKINSKADSYLMFDMDVIENNKNYKYVNDNKDKFVTIFNEINVSNYIKENIKNAYTDKWNEYGISIDDSNVSLLSFVIHDPYEKVVFVGHTGVVVKLDNNVLFIEKIAFEQPYQISIFKTLDEVVNMVLKRPSFYGDGTEEGPFVYENNNLIYTNNK